MMGKIITRDQKDKKSILLRPVLKRSCWIYEGENVEYVEGNSFRDCLTLQEKHKKHKK